MGWLRSVVNNRLEKIYPKIRNEVVEMVASDIATQLAKEPEFRFLKAGQLRLLEGLSDCTPEEAWNLFGIAVVEFCQSENCNFGDPRFPWDRDSAREIAEEFVLEHGEA